VRDEHHGAAVVGDSSQEREHRAARVLVEISRRLVREHEGRVVDEPADDREPLLLAAGERRRKPARLLDELEPPDELARPLDRAVPLADEPCRQQDVVEPAQLRQEVEGLEDEADLPAPQLDEFPLAGAVDPRAGDLDRACVGDIESPEQVQERRLAGSGPAEDSDELPSLHVEVDAVEHTNRRAALAIRLDDVAGADDPICHGGRVVTRTPQCGTAHAIVRPPLATRDNGGAMLVRFGVLALAGLLGLLGSMLLTRKSLAAAGQSDTSTTTTTAASTTAGTTSGTSTAVSTSTVPTPLPVGTPATPTFGQGCLTLGGVMVLLPGRRPLVLNPIADPAHARRSTGAFVYPADGAVVRTEGVDVRARACRGSRASGRSSVASPSLFGGTVIAAAGSLTVTAGHGKAVVRGLRVNGKSVTMAAGARIAVAGWGYATVGERRAFGSGSELQAALAVHLLAAHAGFPAGTIVVAAFAVTAPRPAPAPRRRAHPIPRRHAVRHARPHKPARRARHRHVKHRRVLSPRDERRRLLARLRRAHRPLTMTPSLGLSHYVFPVAGPASFGDSYGAPRSDVSWHHGDDIFAPLGAPVVAVADGTLNRVGWERLGGWRLWVRDRLGNEFYYAHLSGYTRTALREKRVEAGQVLGFVGDTGDAFGTPFHLHFEIHPRSLLTLRYDGAVDPTTYLEHWQRLSHRQGSRPLHPALPTGIARAQAIYVYRELLAARGLIRRRPSPLPIRPRSSTGGDFGSGHAMPRHRVQKRAPNTLTASEAPASTFTLGAIAVAFLATPAALAATLFRRGGR
jgi:hypothetical protein